MGPLRGKRIPTPSEIGFRLAEQARFARERAAAGRADESPPSGPSPGESAFPEAPVAALRDLDATRRLWIELHPEAAAAATARSDAIRAGRIPVFSDIVSFEGAIDWHRDYVTGRRAPLRFYHDLHRLDPAETGDPKNIWEINRHNFLLHLGKAYVATGNRDYYEAWRGIVRSWIEANPHNLGINWESSIELAIRAINWLWSGWLMRAELARDGALQGEIRESLLLHAEHIERHLSTYFSPNTHLTAEALALAYVGAAYPSAPFAARWRRRGMGILEEELPRQVLPDGGYFEMATWYHKYTIDFYLHHLVLAGGRSAVAPAHASRVAKCVEHLALISEPDGSIPLIGDADGGELLSLGSDKGGVLGSCCAAAVLLDDPDLAALCGERYSEEAIWLAGAPGFERWKGLVSRSTGRSYRSFNVETGLFCLRPQRGPDTSYVLVDCGPHGFGSCAHSHADLLSFEWYCSGAKVIADPGTLTYASSSPMRDEERGSRRHNTLTLCRESQSVPAGPFSWRSAARPGRGAARAFEGWMLFEGRIAHTPAGYDHRRTVVCRDGGPVVIVDVAAPRGGRACELFGNLQFTEGNLERIGEHVYVFRSSRNGRRYFARIVPSRPGSSAVREGALYPDYNRSVPAPRLTFAIDALAEEALIVTILGEGEPLVRSFSIERVGEADGRLRLVGAGGTAIVFDRNGVSSVSIEGRTTELAREGGDPAAAQEGRRKSRGDAHGG